MLLLCGTARLAVLSSCAEPYSAVPGLMVSNGVPLPCLNRNGSRVGAVVRALASHQCVPGSIPGPGVICGLSLLLVLYSAPRGFYPGTPVFPSHQKPTLLNSNSIWKQWMKSHLVEMPLQIPIIIIIIMTISFEFGTAVARHLEQA